MEEFNLRYGKTAVSMTSQGFRVYYELPDSHMHVYLNDVNRLEVHLYFKEIFRQKYLGLTKELLEPIKQKEVLDKFLDLPYTDVVVPNIYVGQQTKFRKRTGEVFNVHGSVYFEVVFIPDRQGLTMKDLIDIKNSVRNAVFSFVDTLLPIDPLIQKDIISKRIESYNETIDRVNLIDNDLPF